MQFSAHLTFAGRCEAAFKFYEQVLGGRIMTMLSYGNSPAAAQIPSEWREKIVHATLALGDTVLAGVDLLPEQYERPQGFFVLLETTDALRTERMFRALAEAGEVKMPVQKTFWSPAFGVLVDQFGIPWELSCGQTTT